MDAFIFNNEKNFHYENKNTEIADFDTLFSMEIKDNEQKKNTTKKQKSKIKYTNLKELLDGTKEKYETQLNKIISGKNLSMKDDSIIFSGKLEIKSKTGEILELNFNQFGGFNISPKTEINRFDNKNFPRKVATFENQQISNINNNKRKSDFSIYDFYSGYEKFLSKMVKNTIDLSKSLNFIKKEQFKENLSKKTENEYEYEFNFSKLPKNLQNYGYIQGAVSCLRHSKFITYNKYYKYYQFNPNRNYIDRTGDWQCGNCGYYNYSFRDFCNRCSNPKL